MGVGSSEAGSLLSFAASVFGFATGWTSYAADYTCYQPRTISRIKVFISTFVGLLFPLLFTQFLGAAVMTASVNTPAYADGYQTAGIGGLLAAVLFPPLGKFGQFCLVILALSIVANNCPNIYSVSLSMQVLARFTARVPRFVWTFIGTCCYIAISIPGYSHFESVLENFMLVIVRCLNCLSRMYTYHSSRRIGLRSMKVFLSLNTSSSKRASGATTLNTIPSRQNYPQVSLPWAPSALACLARSWACLRCGSSVQSGNILAVHSAET